MIEGEGYSHVRGEAPAAAAAAQTNKLSEMMARKGSCKTPGGLKGASKVGVLQSDQWQI